MNPLESLLRLVQAALDIPEALKPIIMQSIQALPPAAQQSLYNLLRAGSGSLIGATIGAFLAGSPGAAVGSLGGIAYASRQRYLPQYAPSPFSPLN